VQIPSVLYELVHFQVVSPVVKVLLVAFDEPVFVHALLEDEADESLLEILYHLGGKTHLWVYLCKNLSEEIFKSTESKNSGLIVLFDTENSISKNIFQVLLQLLFLVQIIITSISFPPLVDLNVGFVVITRLFFI